MLAERAARKVGAGIAAPGKAQDQQDEVDGIIAVHIHRQAALEVDERVKAEQNHTTEVDKAAQLAKIQRFIMGDEHHIIKQHRQKAHSQQRCARRAAGAEHEQHGKRHRCRIQVPLLFAKAHCGKHFMNAKQADSRQHQVKQDRVKESQNHGKNSQPDYGGNDASFHKRWFPFNSSCGVLSLSPAMVCGGTAFLALLPE